MTDTIEIRPEGLRELLAQGWRLLDLREESARGYGVIPDAVVPSAEELQPERLRTLPGVILYDDNGRTLTERIRLLREAGVNACLLSGGYAGWVVYRVNQEDDGQKRHKIEEGLRKRWHKRLFNPFAKAVKNYQLVQEGDRIAVCISGGKDSMLMAKLFQQLQWHRQCHFELVFLVMDPGYTDANRRVIERNAELLGIPIQIFESRIFDVVYREEKSPCYLCARMRRGYLYSRARELGCNKIALGHHYDDVIETILMGMLYGGQVQSMMPKLHSTNFEGMELIRPMYLIREDDIKAWRDANQLQFIQCACHFTENCTTCDTDGRSVSKRQEIKQLIRRMKEINPLVEANIFRSVENVQLDTMIAYKKGGVRHSFLDDYDK